MNRPAALAVCAAATDTAEATLFLDMLGIWPEAEPMNQAVLMHDTSPRLRETRET